MNLGTRRCFPWLFKTTRLPSNDPSFRLVTLFNIYLKPNSFHFFKIVGKFGYYIMCATLDENNKSIDLVSSFCFSCSIFTPRHCCTCLCSCRVDLWFLSTTAERTTLKIDYSSQEASNRRLLHSEDASRSFPFT